MNSEWLLPGRPARRPARGPLVGLVLALLGALLTTPVVTPPAQAAEGTEWGVVSGRVVDPCGSPVGSIDLVAGPYSSAAEADGTFLFDLPAGSHRLVVGAASEAHAAVTSTVVVTEGGTTRAGDLVVGLRGAVCFAGVVASAGAGQPVLAEADVDLVALQGAPGGFTDHEVVASTATGADGRYAFSVPQDAARYYTVAASATGHRNGYLGGGTDPLAAATLRADQVRTAPTLSLKPAPSARGTVFGPGAVPLAGVEVQLWRWDPGMQEFLRVSGAVSRANGAYAVRFVGSGEHTLFFDPSADELASRVADPGWLGGDAPVGPGSPGVFSYAGGTDDVVRDHVLAAPPFATGTLTSGGGAPLAGVEVEVLTWDGAFFSTTGTTTRTAVDGTFRIRLPRGVTVSLSFAGPDERVRYLGGGTEWPEEPTALNSVAVTGDVQLGTLVDGVRTAPPPVPPSVPPTSSPTATPTTPPTPPVTPTATPTPTVTATPTALPTTSPPSTPTTPTSGPVPTEPPAPTQPPVVPVVPVVPVAPAPSSAPAKVTLTAPGKVSPRGTLTLRVRVAAEAGGVLEVRRGSRVVTRAKVKPGGRTVKVTVGGRKLTRLATRRGVVRLRASFVTTGTTTPVRSGTVTVRLRGR